MSEFENDRNALVGKLIDVVYDEKNEEIDVWINLKVDDDQKSIIFRYLLHGHFKCTQLSTANMVKISCIIVHRKQLQIDIDELEAIDSDNGYQSLDNLLSCAEIAVNHLPLVELDETSGYYVRLGQAVFAPNLPTSGLVRLKQTDGLFIGVGEITDEGKVKPHRIIANPQQ